MKRWFPLISLLAVIFGGCAAHKIDRDAAPSVSAPDSYSPASSPDSLDNNGETGTLWWYSFERPTLTSLIEQSLQDNLDIAQAMARIEQSQAFRRTAASGLYPQLSLEARASESRRGSSKTSSEETGAVLSWEIDVFKRIASSAKGEQLRTLARVEDLNALKLSLSAELANAYFGAVAAHQNLQLLNEQLQMDNNLLSLTKLRLQTGVGTQVEVLQQASRVAESESLIPIAESRLRVFENRIDILSGISPDGIDRVDDSDSLNFASQLPRIGVPADLLLRRPDLRAAQAELIAADADIAAAIAERLPRLTLEGRYFDDNHASSDPLGIISASFIQPLLDWGYRRAMVKRNKAVYREKLAAFSQRFLIAVEEVENTLYQEHKQREYVVLLEARRQILQNTVEETEALYTQGVSDYLPVLSALQELRDIERDLVSEQLRLISLRIQLHRALGGAVYQPASPDNHSLNQEQS